MGDRQVRTRFSGPGGAGDRFLVFCRAPRPGCYLQDLSEEVAGRQAGRPWRRYGMIGNSMEIIAAHAR